VNNTVFSAEHGGDFAGAYPGYSSTSQFPRSFVNSTVFIAEHGSASSPAQPGFRVAAVSFKDYGPGGTATSHTDFISGWLQHDGPWGETFL